MFVAACALAAAAGAACREPDGTGPAATALDLPSASAKRHPDGVVLEPPPAMPSIGVRAEARGVVALREPLGEEAVKNVVSEMMKAFTRKDISALEQMLTPDAGYFDNTRRVSRAAMLDAWRRRMQQLDYGRLSGAEIVRADKIQRYEYDEVGGANEPARPPEMRPGEILVRAPVETPRVGSDKYFGDVLVIVLRAENGRYKVSSFQEVDAN